MTRPGGSRKQIENATGCVVRSDVWRPGDVWLDGGNSLNRNPLRKNEGGRSGMN